MSVKRDWTKKDLKRLEGLQEADSELPSDSPRALLSIRLSVFRDDTTSPIRQELDLRQLALDQGYRVVGVASDLGVSATKVPPWKRQSLGDWLNNRAPEFDAILFWKLDRFIRNINDLNVMIRWAEQRDKNLVSKNDPIDLSTTMGKIMVTFIGGVAEIEAANTSTRVRSMWSYAKAQTDWIVGKAPYGYRSEVVNGKRVLVLDDDAVVALRFARDRLLEGLSLSAIVKEIKGKGMMSPGLTVATLKRRLATPGTLGYRVEESPPEAGFRRSQLVYDTVGKPIRVAPPIFTQEEWDEIQDELEKRSKSQPARVTRGTTPFLGVMVCAECGGSMVLHRTTQKPTEKNRLKETKVYQYLKCWKCRNGGMSLPDPEGIFQLLESNVLEVLGDFPVEVREYAHGDEARRKVKELQDRISYYMTGLEPGGRLTKTTFSQEQAEQALDAALVELEGIDPELTEDRWVYTSEGRTFREQWESGGRDQMSADLQRAGITCVVSRVRDEGERSARAELRLEIPKDVRNRLIIREDEFSSPV